MSIDQAYSIPVDVPEFTATERAVLRERLKSPLETKVRQYVDHQLISRFLNTSDCSQDLKRGWLLCRQAMDNLPVQEEAPEVVEEFTSIQEEEVPATYAE